MLLRLTGQAQRQLLPLRRVVRARCLSPAPVLLRAALPGGYSPMGRVLLSLKQLW
ncbi:MAG TPA: hypothetical protein PKZ67_01400 [Accumulibacter sp.]|uniref:Uncharacterized protein n=2 Tax=Candidatus Accumulibacter TaxID=327159 RepID=A0A080MA37_9PROT|nr:MULTISPECIES: hypothetical protein [Candidatus Accumulibacter]KFB78152.1 MAG: hypothetical protein AW06_000543 [Candidatus Accumulibacter cognatus]MBL8400379.1 hypothetical protein [Accumulibacter sp.]MBN8516388.1 hypothetical protein [Accumulibacter sp.]MBO3712426.1 hypothetical protein [Accumulibacter sp.]MCC2867548.1 hypothetical protein [Candidatus Accumulibacter phosphatis]